jgi:hypothetical protein
MPKIFFQQCRPKPTDIAAQANVGFRGNCGSGRRSLETSKMTQTGPPMYLALVARENSHYEFPETTNRAETRVRHIADVQEKV